MINIIARRLKRLMPQFVREWRKTYVLRSRRRRFAGLGSGAIFDTIYKEGFWARPEKKGGPSSGEGSLAERIVSPYVNAVAAFLDGLPRPPRVVDIGCGDFRVGRRLVEHTASYAACDVSKLLIDWLKHESHDPRVKFYHLDAAHDELPDGDVVFVRQVLQHLSNADIALILPKLRRYEFLVLTEHLPSFKFTANLDKPTGPDMRLGLNSGVVVTEPPFLFRPLSEEIMCEVIQSNGERITTTLFRLR